MRTLTSPSRHAGSATRARGHALVGTMGFLILAMFLWAAAFARTTGCLRTLKACQLRADGAAGPTRALAWGLALLETGLPPDNPYSCRVQPDGNSGFVLTFQEVSALRYAVAVRPAVPEDAFLPQAPDTFENE